MTRVFHASFVFAALALPQELVTAELKPASIRAFDSYIRTHESAFQRKLAQGEFLRTDESASRRSSVRAGTAAIDLRPGRIVKTGDALIHDWTGAVFVPGVTLDKAVSFVRNYANHKNVYKPEVIDSRVLRNSGNDYSIFLKLVKHKVITVTLNTEHDVRYFPLDAMRLHSRSYSTRIAEIKDAGKPGERELPAGKDHGFLWRLYSYWRFQERDGGVYIESDAISLTRDIPFGLGWLITPIIRDLPRESLERVLTATRSALSD
jgi:hypothetical protein